MPYFAAMCHQSPRTSIESSEIIIIRIISQQGMGVDIRLSWMRGTSSIALFCQTGGRMMTGGHRPALLFPPYTVIQIRRERDGSQRTGTSGGRG
ncbi:hypothetical protein M407DRAFT_179051 [Tulasnella calospora MUT 4182]|uniref:Uncharacterized protein n=1 Tax=Tulasnella calospora MUT 4182 TaxID=1051891 RepID=A0A0C3M4Y5_9AGAM|nr:hypothetical protein M407DRAFT_179051 [Tulasnella calospora MUT 4182]